MAAVVVDLLDRRPRETVVPGDRDPQSLVVIQCLALQTPWHIGATGCQQMTVAGAKQVHLVGASPLRNLDGLFPSPSPVTAESNRGTGTRSGLPVTGFGQPGDLPGFGMTLNQRRIPDVPGHLVRRNRDGHWISPGLSEVGTEPSRGWTDCQATTLVEHQLSHTEISQRRPHTDRWLAIFSDTGRTRIRPCSAVIVTGQYERSVGIVAPDQHQHPVLLGHVDDVGNRDHPVPAFGDDLKPCRQPERPSLTIELSHDMRLPLGQSGRGSRNSSQHNQRHQTSGVFHPGSFRGRCSRTVLTAASIGRKSIPLRVLLTRNRMT